MIILGIGSNLSSKFGNRFTNIDLAVAYLEAYKINVIKKSSFYETPSYPDDKNPKFINIVIAVSTELPPEDLAAWSQNQFEKYLSLFLDNIPKHIKRDNLCLGGGCALNILANTKILEEGIYKNVHVNTAPNDDGLHFGAALSKSIEYEDTTTLPNDIGYLGITYTDEDIEEALCLNK